MKKKILVGIIFLSLVGGAFYAAKRSGLFAVRKMNVAPPISEIAQQSISQPAAVATDQNTDNHQPEVSSQQETVSQLPTVANKQKPIESSPKTVADNSKSSVSGGDGKIVSKLVSWGFQKASGRTIKAIIVHTSYNNLGGDVFDYDKVLQEWKDAGVAPHYAIDRAGTIYQLVADQNIAWHAGTSKLPDGTTDVNGASIGVEVVNSQDAKFTDTQYAALNSLIANLKGKYPIKYVLGHDEIAPGRKTDPWGIDWGKVKK